MSNAKKRIFRCASAVAVALSLSAGGGAAYAGTTAAPPDGLVAGTGRLAADESPTQEIDGVVKNGVTTFKTEGGSLTVLPATGAVPANLGTLAASIGCGLNVQNVHGSTHVSGTINGVARIDCNGPAGSLQISYSLIRLQPYTQWGGPTKTNGGWTFIQTNRAVSCSAGPADFRGWAQGIIAPPPGYTLTGPALTNAYGNISAVACGLSSARTAAADTPNEVLSVTFTRNDLL
jgi:hypothetical protein